MKTSELIGPALDWAVAKCEGWNVSVDEFLRSQLANSKFAYSTVWAKGGPLIEWEKIRLVFRDLGTASYWCAEAHEAYQGNQYIDGKGPTPLIAAMRCYVASKLGDEVEIPSELQP